MLGSASHDINRTRDNRLDLKGIVIQLKLRYPTVEQGLAIKSRQA